MASRVQQDTFIDDSDDACPLCVEEFDLSDKNFRPCPCGYQVCQFCYNNIKNNLNGLCPACRRPYDEKNIEWKVVSPEEFKADVALQARKKAAARQKEAERRQVETLNRKHLAGLRVVQKNLVYVVGLNPRIREEDLLQTLRGDQYFGQYGKIIKIVVSKAKEGANANQSMGVYVTFARKQDAASCIAAVDGSQNGDRVLRAQYGTTKYCSAYLRNEPCNNKNCMFLHETGEDNDSFSRQDLSSMNVVSTQRPPASSSAGAGQPQQGPPTTQAPQPQPPPQQAPQTVAAAAQPMGRQGSKDDTMSRSDSGDGSALPSSASWANKGPQLQQSRSTSQAASRSTPSPTTNPAALAQTPEEVKRDKGPDVGSSEQSVPQTTNETPFTLPQITTRQDNVPGSQPPTPLLNSLFKSVNSPDFKFVFSPAGLSADELEAISNHPPLIDDNGGAKRRLMREEEQQERRKREEEEQKVLQAVSAAEEEENPESGSLQLGGEPEARSGSGDVSNRTVQQQQHQQRHAIQPPSQHTLPSNLSFDSPMSVTNNLANLSINGRSLTPLQQQQLLLLKSNSGQAGAIIDQFQPGFPSSLGLNQSYPNPPSLFQGHNHHPNQPLPGAQTHARQASRYTFANDSASASAEVKPAANAKLMAQQSAMMPPGNAAQATSQAPQQHPLSNQFYGSGAQGPPPGLKSVGTPPISGGGMFGQGHGFASAMGGGLNYGGGRDMNKDTNAEMMRELLRGRTGAGNGQGADIGKREYMFPSFLHQHPSTSTPAPAPGLLSSLYGAQLGAFQDIGAHKQKKKGKKHRHANTSSSGGGGIVDLADPSILQARMHHGATSNGQGLFGGQGQGEESLPPLEEASISVDALVSETTTEITDRPATGAGIVGFKAFAPPSLFSAPPGLSLPHAHPPPAVVADMSSESKLQPQPLAAASNTSNPAVVPAIPMLPITPAQLATPLKKDLRSAQSPMPQQTTSSPSKSSILDSKLPSDLSQTATKSVFASTGSPKREAMAGTTISLSSPVKVLMRKTSKIQDRETAASTADVKSETTQVDAHSQDSLGIQQRQHPGKLDISAATDASTKSQTVPASSSSKALETSTKNIHSAPPAISSGPRLEASISQTSGSPSSRQSQPRTIRVLPTAKTEIQPPPPASALLPAVASPVAVTKIPSRQPSLASINRPATPISELISDNASMTSTSVSRANSPPPTKVGIAPVRQVTKSQQKKERQARAKMVEESKKSEETVEKAAPEEPEQAPIIGRKKKAKKPTTTDATASSTPAPSRPGSPAAKESENVAPELEKPVPLTPAKESRKEIKKDVSKAQEKKTSEVSVAPQTSTVNDPSQRTSLTAASIIADLQASGDINPATLEFFKNVPGINYRHEISSADFRDLDRKIVISDDERVMLSQGHPVHLAPSSDKTSSRMMISPAGAFLRGLTPEQEQRFVELEKRTMSATGPAKFNPGRHGNEVGARAFQTYQEVATNGILHQKAAADPAANKKLDEALNYVNQFIDPTSLPDGGSQKSKTGYEVDDFGLNYKSAREQQWLRKPLMTVEEAEAAIQVARKETEALEKRLNGLLKRNKRFVFGGAH